MVQCATSSCYELCTSMLTVVLNFGIHDSSCLSCSYYILCSRNTQRELYTKLQRVMSVSIFWGWKSKYTDHRIHRFYDRAVKGICCNNTPWSSYTGWCCHRNSHLGNNKTYEISFAFGNYNEYAPILTRQSNEEKIAIIVITSCVCFRLDTLDVVKNVFFYILIRNVFNLLQT